MKTMKKMMAVLVALVMTLAMGVTAFAQTKDYTGADGDGATITINNPAKGETYTIYKLFDATYKDGNIAYQLPAGVDVPAGLTDYFEKDASNNILPKDSIAIKDDNGKITGTNMTAELKAALKTWAESATATDSAVVTDGDTDLIFRNLPYGYYVVTASHEEDGETITKSAITVTSTDPDASIYDKNATEITVKKEVEEESYSIGDTVRYTATFGTTNYVDEDGTPKQVVNYVIKDTLPEFLSGVKVTKILIGLGEDTTAYTEYKVDNEVPQFNNKTIVIPWATEGDDGKYTSNYAQGSTIVMMYEATLTSTTNINADDTNTVSIQPYVVNPDNPENPEPWKEPIEDTAVIRTYAAAIQKTDDAGNALNGATFKIKGLTVEEVTEEGVEHSGIYRVVSYDPSAESTVESMEMFTDKDGKLYIIGLSEEVALVVTEFKAPDGYNKLTTTETLNAQKLTEEVFETSGTRYYDEDGNLVKEEINSSSDKTVDKNLSDLDVNALKIKNNKGSLLPSTGGIGTTIFYIVGAALVIGAAVLLVTKKRMSKEA